MGIIAQLYEYDFKTLNSILWMSELDNIGIILQKSGSLGGEKEVQLEVLPYLSNQQI
jgi:hypothetical protein